MVSVPISVVGFVHVSVVFTVNSSSSLSQVDWEDLDSNPTFIG